jgi:hypothetical protein
MRLLFVLGHLLVGIGTRVPALLPAPLRLIRPLAMAMVVVVLLAAIVVMLRPSALRYLLPRRSRGAVIRLRIRITITRRAVRRRVVRRLIRSTRLVVDAADCARVSPLVNSTQLNPTQPKPAQRRRGTVPFDDFLPMPSLSTTSSAHWMWRRSEGSARRRSTPDGADRRTAPSVTSMVRLPVSRKGVAVREGVDGVAVLCGVDILQC